MSRLNRSITTVCLVAVAVTSASAQTQQKETVYRPGNGVTLPQVIRQVDPEYTDEARKARISGTVLVEVTVTTEGTVEDVQVIRSLEKTLDRQAVDAAKKWRFKPGTKDRKPVPVRVSLEMTFNLK